MLINLTNHPSSKWSDHQMDVAVSLYEEVTDYNFPQVSPEWEEQEIEQLASNIVDEILDIYKGVSIAIHVMGEFTLCYSLISKFKSHGITCVASTTSRIVTENPDGTKTSTFSFIRFREYK